MQMLKKKEDPGELTMNSDLTQGRKNKSFDRKENGIRKTVMYRILLVPFIL